MGKKYITFDYSQFERLPETLLYELDKRISIFKDALEITANYAVKLYSENAPEDTGALKEHIMNTEIRYKSADDFFSDIGTDIETDYWRFLEYGTIFIDPNPFVSQQRKTINKYLKNVCKEMLVKAGLEVI